ncbi:MAG: decarboxylating NADP(+)-dependent phosphogluconate dehydrogenase [Kiritimatiellae bacterium]|nr:decarboxylating NADP(+)-dependent phosphogluconate dehydrogenase [Kiritimatiellia bacterium]
MPNADIGLIGLGVMGENLVLNMAGHGYTVAVFNRTTSKIDAFLDGLARGRSIVGAYSPQDLVRALKRPRRIVIMVKAGPPVDAVIADLVPLLDPDDILVDGGNSYFQDTQRRVRDLEQKGLLFIGTGVSGGEEGALKGPSIMPGGSEKAWPHVKKIFQDIAAQADGAPCCEWIGPDGAGHFVKMVHNGIEYGDMQLIAEAYFLLKQALGMEPPELEQVFARWNEGELDSYLIDITSRIFRQKDPETGRYLADVILDAAGQKGTGAWTGQVALELGEPVPTIAEAVFARYMSTLKEERVAAANVLPGPGACFKGDRAALVEDIRRALYASKICSYAQGFELMRAAAEEYDWNLHYGQIAMIWRAGCIIRARFLGRIKEAYDRDPALANLLLDPHFRVQIQEAQPGWRRVVIEAARLGLPVPAFSSALAYYDSYRTANLPANLLQAQRDFFGAHTYERIDRPRGEFFHTEWND